jgi:hypothetical protein
MSWHRLTAASLLFASAALLFTAEQAQANRRVSNTARCLVVTSIDTGERRFVTEAGLPCPANSSTSSVRPTSVVIAPVMLPVTESLIDPEDHSFELFNNSYRDILFLQLFPLSSPDEVAVLGGTRALAPGRAWNINLNRGCEYNVLVEYKDGVQDFYEGVNTCVYRGIQFR